MTAPPGILPPLACPTCEALLVEDAAGLRCEQCARSYPVSDGIPRFNPDGFYWGEIPRPHMRAVLDRARVVGWKEAARELLPPSRPDLWDYITDPGRADFRHYLPFGRDSDVLDLGAGWGTLTTALAPHCRSVTAVEGVEERVSMLQLRCRQEGLANVRAVRSDFLRPPFPPASFDVVLMNGVLEWVGCADAGSPPGIVQRRFLRRIRRLIRPGGGIYVGIENRTGFRLWLGARDHSGLPFTSLLPRSAASLMTSLLPSWGPRGAYRTYTYTYWGYRRLLDRCGFSAVEIYAALPSYNAPRYLAPLDRAAPVRFLLRQVAVPARGRRLAALAAYAPLAALRLLVGSFAITARVNQ